MSEITEAQCSIKNSRINDFRAATLVAVERQTEYDQWVDLDGRTPRQARGSPAEASLFLSVFYLVKMLYPNFFFFEDSEDSSFTTHLDIVILRRSS